MSYKEDFLNDDGWSAVDVSFRLNTTAGRKFTAFLRQQGVDTVIRYYASTPRQKTITLEEAKFLSSEGFGLLPVFQDRNRQPSDFTHATGLSNADSAMEFAQRIGQPEGSTILFAVDADLSAADIDQHVVPYFSGINDHFKGAYTIGAYGSGAVLSKLLHEKLIVVPWLSMSRLFQGTEQFFYSDRWALRQIAPEANHAESMIGYDRNIVRAERGILGTFQIDDSGAGHLAWDEETDAVLSTAIPGAPDAGLTGADRLVTTEGLRLRMSPGGPVLRELTIGERVIDLGAATENGWRRIHVDSQDGVVFEKYLRMPVRQEIEVLLRATLDEWIRFDKGRADEKSDPHYNYVRDMWAAIGEPYDGRSLYPSGEEVPWSAAFISWVVRKAGPAYSNFRFAPRHSEFVNNAIKARMLNRLDKPFWGYRISEKKPELGDIIQRNRAGGNYSYSYAENHERYASHSDIVVEVTPDVVRVIGGNVDDTVGLSGSPHEYHLDSDGYLQQGQKLIALLKNRAGLL